MNNRLTTLRALSLALACSGASALHAQPASSPAPAAETNPSEDTIVLSPFAVTTNKDSGYKATNSISGTRLDAAIKDIPMPIEVITDQFIKDTGSGNLREALRYSAGVLLQTQNDQGASGYKGPGGVNNPEGVTADPSNTFIKVRGFVTDTMLRDGFRRQNSTDSVNLSRIEVVRGPAALLYGIGNFGGIVNYLPRLPETKAGGEAGLVVGTYNFLRGTVTQTGPVTSDKKLSYRVSAAAQSTGDHTDFYKEKHYFVSPIIEYKPFAKTDIIADFEYGQQTVKGLGFMQVRSVAGVGVNNDQNENGGMFTVPGTNPRKFRLSGGDTYMNQQAGNMELKATQEIFPNLNVLIGYNHSTFKYQTRDVIGSLNQNVGPKSLQKTVILYPVDPNTPSSNLNVKTGPVDNVVLQYTWNKAWFSANRDQERAELNYKLELFQNRNHWLQQTHSFLAGVSVERNEQAYSNWGNPDNTFNYYDPTSTAGIVYDHQGDGNPNVPMIAKTRTVTTGWDKAAYAVYNGTLVDKRVHILGGVRRDKNDLQTDFSDYVAKTVNQLSNRPQAIDTTRQGGVSYNITREISVYALSSGGLQPNFSGAKDGYGTPMGAVTARSNEFGLKIDLFNGKVSATISRYRITKEGTPISYWWAPSAIDGKTKWDTSKDIVYNVNNFTPTNVVGGSNGGNGATDASQTQWNAAVAAGAAYQKGGNWYVNASQATGAAYLDAVFQYTQDHGDSWPGWLYNYDSNTNNSWVDIASANGTSQTGSSQSKGWDGQLLFTPTDNIQIVLNYAQTQVVVLNPGNFIKYPGSKDRWAVWYFPNTDWGLTGQTAKAMYGTFDDTSTWTGSGYGAGQKMDDTPKHHVDWFGIYRFKKGPLDGLSVGLGGVWESQREYLSGITHGAGQKITDTKGLPIVRSTPCRLNMDFMVNYQWKRGTHPMSVQLNVNNVLNDTKLYGLLFSSPLTARFEYRYGW